MTCHLTTFYKNIFYRKTFYLEVPSYIFFKDIFLCNIYTDDSSPTNISSMRHFTELHFTQLYFNRHFTHLIIQCYGCLKTPSKMVLFRTEG